MNERFEFLKFIASNSSVKVSKDILSAMWTEMVSFQMFQSDSDLFYRFLKEVCDLHQQGFEVVAQ